MSHRSASLRGSIRASEILDAAATAFDEQGYDATSLDYIGDTLGVTKGSIYYHYRSKADLFLEIYRRVMESNLTAVRPIASQENAPPLKRLYFMLYTHSLQVLNHLSYQRVVIQGLEGQLMARVSQRQRTRFKDVILLRDEYEELFIDVVANAIEVGELVEQNPRLATKPLFGAINWATMWYTPANESSYGKESVAKYLTSFILGGLKYPFDTSQFV